jgi:hypothetical protein
MRRDVLRYTCGHFLCGCCGRRFLGLPCAGTYQIKDIDAPCRDCARPVKRLPPGLAEKVAEEEWV